RLLCAAVLSLVCGVCLVYAEDRADKLKTLKKKHDEENKELVDRYKKAVADNNAADARAIQSEMRELAVLYAGKARNIAEDNPKDGAGYDALAFVMQMASQSGAGGSDVEKALALLGEHHATNPKVKDFLTQIPRLDPRDEKVKAGADKFLKAVSEKAT